MDHADSRHRALPGPIDYQDKTGRSDHEEDVY